MIKRFLKPVGDLWVIFLVFGLFWFNSSQFIDPDFGIHIRLGEYILDYGVPHHDPFSYTMPSFEYIYHEWIPALLFFKLYPFIGIAGLSILFSAMAAAAIAISIPSQYRKGGSALILLGAAVIFDFLGVRVQVFSWLLYAILIQILFDGDRWKINRWLIPLIILIWVNIHGGFSLGIASLILFIAVKFFRTKLIDKLDLIVIGASLVATFINPYYQKIWLEVWRTGADSSLRWSIQEWLPIFLNYNLPFYTLLVITTCFLIRYRRSFLPEQLVLFGFLTLLTFSSQRIAPFLVILSLPLLSKAIWLFYKQITSDHFGLPRFKIAYKGLLILATGLFILNFIFDSPLLGTLNETTFYPSQAIKYLKDHPSQSQMFSPYDWGGYLLWKYPEKKVFVDGRMPSWKRESAPDQESLSAFNDYNEVILFGKDFNQLAKKYDIEYVLWPNQTNQVRKVLITQLLPLQYHWLIKYLVFTRGDPNIKSFPAKLIENGWVVVYEDPLSVIYQKPNIN